MPPAPPPAKDAKDAKDPKAAEVRPTIAALRKLARTHSEAAVQVLAEVATQGSSEASRVSAAMALLERGYGKSGSAAPGDIGPRAPILHHRIELVDGITDQTPDQEHEKPRDQD